MSSRPSAGAYDYSCAPAQIARYALATSVESRPQQGQSIEDCKIGLAVVVLQRFCMQLLLASLWRPVAVTMAQPLQPSSTWLPGQPQ
jgi:hypothetical protein